MRRIQSRAWTFPPFFTIPTRFFLLSFFQGLVCMHTSYLIGLFKRSFPVRSWLRSHQSGNSSSTWLEERGSVCWCLRQTMTGTFTSNEKHFLLAQVHHAMIPSCSITIQRIRIESDERKHCAVILHPVFCISNNTRKERGSLQDHNNPTFENDCEIASWFMVSLTD